MLTYLSFFQYSIQGFQLFSFKFFYTPKFKKAIEDIFSSVISQLPFQRSHKFQQNLVLPCSFKWCCKTVSHSVFDIHYKFLFMFSLSFYFAFDLSFSFVMLAQIIRNYKTIKIGRTSNRNSSVTLSCSCIQTQYMHIFMYIHVKYRKMVTINDKWQNKLEITIKCPRCHGFQEICDILGIILYILLYTVYSTQ